MRIVAVASTVIHPGDRRRQAKRPQQTGNQYVEKLKSDSSITSRRGDPTIQPGITPIAPSPRKERIK
jgi:hypothetical protein